MRWLSDPMTLATEPSCAITHKSRYAPLWTLLLIALLPLVAALLSYFGGLAQPDQRVNRGELVLHQSLSQWPLTTISGEPWEIPSQWHLLLLVPQCQQQCLQWQHLLGQVKTSLGRDRHRVQPRLVLTGPPVRSAQQPEALTLSIEPVSLPQLLLTQPGANAIEQGIWLADPLGNLVLYYRFDQPPQDLLKDLKRLLKLSKLG